MEKLLLTCGAFKGKMAFMLLHMIMHSVLVFFRHLANATDELSIPVLLIFHSHGMWWLGGA
jgi:hypothetical protein